MIPNRTAAFGLIALALTGTIGLQLADYNTQPASSLVTPVPVPTGTGRSQAAPSRTEIDRQLDEILARPVFSPDRRPVAVGVHSVAGLTRLTGIVVTGSRKIAIFASGSGGQPVIAEEGSHLNAFEVMSISETGVTVMGPGGMTVMTPIFDPAPPLAPRPSGAARPEPPRAAKK